MYLFLNKYKTIKLKLSSENETNQVFTPFL